MPSTNGCAQAASNPIDERLTAFISQVRGYVERLQRQRHRPAGRQGPAAVRCTARNWSRRPREYTIAAQGSALKDGGSEARKACDNSPNRPLRLRNWDISGRAGPRADKSGKRAHLPLAGGWRRHRKKGCRACVSCRATPFYQVADLSSVWVSPMFRAGHRLVKAGQRPGAHQCLPGQGFHRFASPMSIRPSS